MIMVIDPVTGAALKTWHGAVEPQRYATPLAPEHKRVYVPLHQECMVALGHTVQP